MMCARGVLFILLALPITAQQAPAPAAFEVASVKAAVPTAGAGHAPRWASTRKLAYSEANGRVDLHNVTLTDLMTLAFGVEPFRVAGPGWMESELFDVSAIAPKGTPKERLSGMFQNLLETRFGLQYRRETRTAPVYALTVRPGGHKLQPGIRDDDADNFGAIAPTTTTEGPNGRVTTASARTYFGIYKLTVTNGVMHYDFPNISMTGLAQFLSGPSGRGPLGMPVLDMTSLEGRFQVAMEMTMAQAHNGIARQPDANEDAADPAGNMIQSSLDKQGLVIARRNVPLDRIVVERIEKTPTAN
jgi:uncharacterized protein (TIGR03435 family)